MITFRSQQLLQDQAEETGLIEYNPLISAIEDDLLTFFKPAFLGRTRILPFLPLSREEMKCICRIALARIKKSIAEKYQATLGIDDQAIEQLVMWNNSPHTGARAIEQIIQQQLMPLLAKECLVHTSTGKTINHVDVRVDGQALKVELS